MSAEQDQEMATILVRLELISHGATVNYNPSGGGSGEPDDRMVAIVMKGEDYPHLAFRRRYRGCNTDKDRAAVIEAAHEELKKWGPRDWEALKDAPSISQEQVVIEDGVGIDPVTLGRRLLMASRQVRKIRDRAGLDPETGKELGARSALSTDEKRSRALALRESGRSTREIADEVGAHQTQVMRWIRG